jgi:hypothetical protein
MKDRLFDITDEMKSIEAVLLDNGGELTEELIERLDASEEKLEKKVENYVYVINHNDARAKEAGGEVKRISALKKTRVSLVDSLKARLLYYLELVKKTKVETPTAVVSVVNNSQPSVEWMGTDLDIPEAMKLEKVELDKKYLVALVIEHLESVFRHQDLNTKIAQMKESGEDCTKEVSEFNILGNDLEEAGIPIDYIWVTKGKHLRIR